MKSLFVRVDPEFHKRVKVEAARRGVSVQAMVERLLARELQQPHELPVRSRATGAIHV